MINKKVKFMSSMTILRKLLKYKKKEQRNKSLDCWVTLGGSSKITIVGCVIMCYDGIPWSFVTRLSELLKLQSYGYIVIRNLVDNGSFVTVTERNYTPVSIEKSLFLTQLKSTTKSVTEKDKEYLLNCADNLCDSLYH